MAFFSEFLIGRKDFLTRTAAKLSSSRKREQVALTLEDKLAGQKQVKALEQQRNSKRRALFDAQDEIDRQRERLIAEIEGKLHQSTELTELFLIRWRLT